LEISSQIKDSLMRGIDIVLPPQSLMTGSLEGGGIEGDIWAQVKFLDEPCCHCCGFPFEFDEGPEALCGRCIIKPMFLGDLCLDLSMADEPKA